MDLADAADVAIKKADQDVLAKWKEGENCPRCGNAKYYKF